MDGTLTEGNKLVSIIMMAIFLLLFMTFALLLLFRYARKKIVEKEVEKANLKIESQQKILQATIETQEVERNRIAQDLHDAISAKLNVVSLHINMLLEDSLTYEEQKDALSKVLGVTTNVLDNSRQIAHNLLPPILSKFGLVAAVEELLSDFSTTKKVEITNSILYKESLTATEELHLFRIIQELLNNALKHGKASKIELVLIDSSSNLKIEFIDNGKGFDVKKALKKNGLGLNNIKSRIAILKGKLFIESKREKGAKFIINIKHNKI